MDLFHRILTYFSRWPASYRAAESDVESEEEPENFPSPSRVYSLSDRRRLEILGTEPVFAPEIELTQADLGWVRLRFTLGQASATLHLSFGFPPFEDIALWVERVASGEDCAVEIDEEVTIRVIEARKVDDGGIMLVQINDSFSGKVQICGLVQRMSLVIAFALEISRFFQNEFVSYLWDWDNVNAVESMRDRILTSPAISEYSSEHCDV